MANVKTALEKALEKAEQIGELTSVEKEEMKDRERLGAVLAAFNKGVINKDGLWKELKSIKPSLLKEAQQKMLDLLRLKNLPEEFQQKKDGILAVESLKTKQNTSAVESLLNSMKKIQKEYNDIKEQAIKELRAAIEENPQLRMRPVKAHNGKTVLQASLSVDEAVQTRSAEFLAEHEKRSEEMFNRAVEKLRKELK